MANKSEYAYIRIVIQTQRKSHGGIGKQRGPKTGKKGTIFVTRPQQNEEMYNKPFSAPTFTALKKLLRATGLIPSSVTINKKGQTSFTP